MYACAAAPHHGPQRRYDLTLFSYPVFNFADCCVVVGAILGAVYYLFFYDKYDKRERPHGNDTPDGDK